MMSGRTGVRNLVRALLLFAVTASTACASGSGGPSVMRQAGDGEGRTFTLTVDNQNFADVTIYALWDVTRDRLGMVTGLTSQTFEVNWRGSDLRVRGDFIAGPEFVTEPVFVARGDHIDLTIPPSE